MSNTNKMYQVSTLQALALGYSKAVISVGENNKFGHPNSIVIDRLKNNGCLIYRTDKMGEIKINISIKGKIKSIKKYIPINV